jgi:hypothetical protein|tara:strand:- start:184 stop:747 length:564 start_codon:yes stop_codon:yes gene_type:complete
VDFQEELKNKKLKLKSDYLRVELEETQWIFRNSLVEFQNDFVEYLEDFDQTKKMSRVNEDVEFDIPKEKVNKVFKKIATKTHPDKNIDNDDSDRLVELYKEAQQSVEKKDWSRVTQIAEELEIDITDVEENDSVFLEKSINNMESKIGEIKQTFAWLWVHSEKENRPQLKKHILNVMGVKEKQNGNK